jgi:ATP-binding cassette subfamily F protein uup
MLLSAEKITKSYSEKILLKDISFYLNEGDKIGVIGVNGTGKSTFLKIIAQLEEPDSGKVTKNPSVRIEYLHQNPLFNENLSVLEQVFLGASPELKDRKEYEAKTILTKLGIVEFHKPICTLSGGQRKRVAIASALIHPCEVLILDEPTNHLDTDMVEWLESYLIKYSGAMIMITHDFGIVAETCDRVAVMYAGEIIESGTLRDIFKDDGIRTRSACSTQYQTWSGKQSFCIRSRD